MQRFVLDAGCPYVRIDSEIDWQERHTLLRPRDLMSVGQRVAALDPEERRVERRFKMAVHEAAKNDDRSENGDYIYGKRRLREIDSRVRFLNKRLEELEVVHRPPDNRDKIYFGASVSLEDEAGELKRWRIVSANPSAPLS